MKSMIGFAVLGGLAIGFINLSWLYLAFWIGLHTSGIGVFQLYMLLWLILNIVLYIVLLRLAKRRAIALSYWSGVGVGAYAAFFSGLVAVFAQIGYFHVVNPGWQIYVTEAALEAFQEQGVTGEELRRKVEQTRLATTATNYSIQSFLSETLLGVILSMLCMLVFREKPTESERSKKESE
ncbi:MAG: DUF4199 domain-containing protein [Planctomycetota bacterium]